MEGTNKQIEVFAIEQRTDLYICPFQPNNLLFFLLNLNHD